MSYFEDLDDTPMPEMPVRQKGLQKGDIVTVCLIGKGYPRFSSYVKERDKEIEKGKTEAEEMGLPYEEPKFDVKKAGVAYKCAIIGKFDKEGKLKPLFKKVDPENVVEPSYPVYVDINQFPPPEHYSNIVRYGREKQFRMYPADNQCRGYSTKVISKNGQGLVVDLFPKSAPVNWKDPETGVTIYIDEIPETSIEKYGKELDRDLVRKSQWKKKLDWWNKLEPEIALKWLDLFIAQRFGIGKMVDGKFIPTKPEIGIVFKSRIKYIKGLNIEISPLEWQFNENGKGGVWLSHTNFDVEKPMPTEVAQAELYEKARINGIEKRKADKLAAQEAEAEDIPF